MKKRLPVLILPIIMLILEVLPCGAVLYFGRPAADGSIGYFRELYSYFDLMPVGYGNFAPLATAVITCAAFILLVIYSISGKPKLAAAGMYLTGGSAVFSLVPLLLGARYYSVVGALITVSLIAEVPLLYFTVKGKRAR